MSVNSPTIPKSCREAIDMVILRTFDGHPVSLWR
jgi:hypothetical protein